MHTYQKNGKDEEAVWTVGFELPTERGHRSWRALRDFDSENYAAAYCSFLNGGEAMWPEWRQP